MSPEQQNKELDALISLIDEPNEDMFSSIRNKIKTYGSQAIPMLEDAWLSTENNENAYRIELLIDDIRFTDLHQELNAWSAHTPNDLLKAFLIVTKFRYPDLDEEKYLKEVMKLKQSIWLEINQELTALEKVKVLNHIFFDVNGFKSQVPAKHSIDSYCLSDLMDNRSGSAIAIGILYLYISQGLDIPIFGIDLPHHFALAYMEDNIPTREPEEYGINDVLFYIAVANKGSVFTKKEIDSFLKQMNIKENISYYSPGSNARVIRRLIKEMARQYKKMRNEEKSDLLYSLIAALD